MNLQVSGLIPIPLRERLQARPSGIWGQDKSFGKGERIFIQAPSGTGKTTLIHLLYGLRSDYDGSISWDGKKLSPTDAEWLAGWRSKHVSVIFQDLRIFPELTAWENLEVKRSLTNTIQPAEVEEWMQRLGIGDKKNSLGKTLSYGEQQRLVIIRALLQPFKWLLMDEPFSHLDINNTAIAARLIEEVADRNGASFILADLDANTFFPYTQTIFL